MLSEKSEWHDFFSEKEVEVNKQWRKQVDRFAWKVEAEDCKKAGLVIIQSFYCLYKKWEGKKMKKKVPSLE